MCRYAYKTYKSHFACFHCRKAFKKTAIDDYVKQIGWERQFSLITQALSSPKKQARVEGELGITYKQIEQHYLVAVSICPQCSKPMAPMGLDFKPPSQEDEEAWQIVTYLYENGFAFFGCGCYVGYTPPTKLSELSHWIRARKKKSKGEILLETIKSKNY